MASAVKVEAEAQAREEARVMLAMAEAEADAIRRSATEEVEALMSSPKLPCEEEEEKREKDEEEEQREPKEEERTEEQAEEKGSKKVREHGAHAELFVVLRTEGLASDGWEFVATASEHELDASSLPTPLNEDALWEMA